jgi:hypothetical protein
VTDEPDITETQKRILDALMIQAQEANFDPTVSAGISDEKLARQLGINVEEVQEAVHGLVDLGFIGTKTEPAGEPARNVDDPWPSPMPQCRRCGKPSDGLDHLCTRCRAIWACDQLVNDLTNSLECFLENRWAPHEYEQQRPAYYHTKHRARAVPGPHARHAADLAHRGEIPRRRRGLAAAGPEDPLQRNPGGQAGAGERGRMSKQRATGPSVSIGEQTHD